MDGNIYRQSVVDDVLISLKQDKKLLQIITGPRQVGKSTAATLIGEEWQGKVIYISADSPVPPGVEWIQFHWDQARRAKNKAPLLIIDEIQKVQGWSEQIKLMWDEDRGGKTGPAVLLLGSSSLRIQKGLSESLSGRFFLHPMCHWQYAEMKEAFRIDMEQWLYYGGYPGAVSFITNETMWKSYIRDSLIETVLSRDVLQMQNIAKPVLLRHLFMLSSSYPSQILSYNKMLGQLTDAGNTTTLAHYIQVLDSAFLLSGLEQYKIGQHPKRGSSPKLVLWNNALINAVSTNDFETTRNNPELWGRIVENAVGASLLNELRGLPYELYYWRRANYEVDYVLHTPKKTWAIEVKSSSMKHPRGLQKFLDLYPDAIPFIIGGNGMPLEDFFNTAKESLFT